jgi:hypothetical protein
MKDDSVLKHKDDRVSLDLFHILQWYYDEGVKDEPA